MTEAPTPQARNEDQYQQICCGEIITLQDKKNVLPLYQEAGVRSRFAVQVIGQEGEEFLQGGRHEDTLTLTEIGRYERRHGRVVERSRVKKGYVAISIARPEESFNHSEFWRAFESLQG